MKNCSSWIIKSRCLECTFSQVSYEFEVSSTGGCDWAGEMKLITANRVHRTMEIK